MQIWQPVRKMTNNNLIYIHCIFIGRKQENREVIIQRFAFKNKITPRTLAMCKCGGKYSRHGYDAMNFHKGKTTNCCLKNI